MNMHCGGLLYGHSCHDRLWSRVGTRGRSRALLEGCQVNCTIEYKIGLHRSVRARKGVCVPLKANASEEETYVSPSSRTGSNELEALERYSEVIPDSQLSECLDKGSKMKAGTSSRRILAGIMANPTSFGKFKFAIEQARFYKPKGVPASELPLVQVDKALVNAAALMLEDVSGKVSVEVDPRAAYDTDKLVAKGLQLIALFAEIGVSKDEVLLRMPATWEAIQAARKLELEGYATHLVCMYSYAQAVAAIQAGVSVIQINIGRINDWYDKHPGVIRDPKGPREDMAMALAGYGAPLENPGLPLVRSIYNYCHQKGAKTKIIVSGMRTKNEAISLAGCDYLVIGPQVINALKSSVTLEGYNDGLRASEGRFESFGPSLTPENAAASTIEELKVTEENFNDKIGMMGRDLLQGYVDRLTADAKRLEPLLLNQAGGQE